MAKIENSLELDYPRGKLQTLVISDGSIDGTFRLARPFTVEQQIEVKDLVRQGKVKLITNALEHATGEVVIVTDATVMLNRGAIRRLVAHFSDSSVAAVSGGVQVYGQQRGATLLALRNVSEEEGVCARLCLLGARTALCFSEIAVSRSIDLWPSTTTI